jgi:hypothetical protein
LRQRSAGSEVVVGFGGNRGVVHVGGKNLVEESGSRTCWNRQHAEAKVDHINLSAIVQLPPPPDCGWK